MSVLSGIQPEGGLLDYKVVLFCIFLGTSTLVLKAVSPPTLDTGSYFSTPSPTLVTLFDNSHPDKCEAIGRVTFIFKGPLFPSWHAYTATEASTAAQW